MKNNRHNNRQQRFFDFTKNQYDEKLILHPPLHTYLEIEALLKTLPKAEVKKLIIDFGAGSGRVTIPLLQRKYSVTAVDISNNSLKKIDFITKKLRLSQLITSNTIPKNKKIQAVVGADILHHIVLGDILPAMYKALEKGGVVSFSEPCAWNPAWHIYLRIASDWEVEKRMIYCNYFNLKQTFEKHGFKNVKIQGLGILPRPFFNWSYSLERINDFLGNLPLLKFFAYRYIITAQK